MTKKKYSDDDRAKRERYVLDVLELTRDPFAFPAHAEKEIQEQPDDPPFFRSFLELDSQDAEQTYLDLLLNQEHVIITGPQGSGKTTLRYNLSHKLRLQFPSTMAVTYEVNGDVQPRRTLPRGLTEALATDLFIQVVEQYGRLGQQIDLNPLLPSLAAYWYAHIPNFRRRLKRHLRQSKTNEGFLAAWWTIWKRPVVLFAPYSGALRRLYEKLLEMGTAIPRRADTRAQLAIGVSLAARLGFQRVFIVVDEGNTTTSLTVWRTVIEQLFEVVARRKTEIPIHLKLFLPEEAAALVHEVTRTLSKPLRSEPVSVIIRWGSPQEFLELLKLRFHSAGAGSRLVGFDVLAAQDVPSSLDEWLIRSANGSPRRLIQLADSLILAHARRAAGEPLISLADCRAVVRDWPYTPPLTPPGTLD